MTEDAAWSEIAVKPVMAEKAEVPENGRRRSDRAVVRALRGREANDG